MRPCRGCARPFVPTGPQRYCSHECYSETLRQPIETRFWRYVNKTAGCWLWTGYTVKGYGALGVNRRPAYAHRLSWELHRGLIPEGVSILHRCDTPLCVRPDHLFLGSQQDNLLDARQKGRLDNSLPRTKKLTYAERLRIYEARAYRGICVDLAREYGVTKTTITMIRKGRFARPRPVLERVPSRQVPILGEVA